MKVLKNKNGLDAELAYSEMSDSIGRIEDDEVLLVQLCSVDLIKKIMSSSVRSRFTVIDRESNIPFFSMCFPEATLIGCEEDIRTVREISKLDKKFSKIIGWPYCSHSDNDIAFIKAAYEKLVDGGSIVCVHPLKWERDMVRHGKTKVPFTSYKIVDEETSQKMLGDYTVGETSITLVKKGDVSDVVDNMTMSIISKIMNSERYVKVSSKSTVAPSGSFTLKLKTGGLFSSPYVACLSSADFKSCSKSKQVSKWNSFISFNSEEEQRRFFDVMIGSDIVKFLVYRSRNRDNAPWLGDAKNERTGKTGFESDWTDDDIAKLFCISDDERKYIESKMKKYKKTP